MAYVIRKAQPGDAPALTDFLIGLGWFQHYFDALPHEAIQQQIDSHLGLCLADNSHSIYVAESIETEIVGYVAPKIVDVKCVPSRQW